jgi:hypothetical protein
VSEKPDPHPKPPLRKDLLRSFVRWLAIGVVLLWSLEHRAPSVRIVCRNWTETPPGLRPWECPNLLWELMRARRVKLTAQQLLSRNTSEALVDKDKPHARDTMKYQVMSHPEPAKKSMERRVQERLAKIIEGDTSRGIESQSEAAMTSAMVKYQKILREEQEDDDEGPGVYQGSNARRRIREMQRRRGRRN